MDARITKQRLGNLLSYDWLKMLVTIAIFVFLVVLLFTMTATRATNAQTFTVYAYNGLSAGKRFNTLAGTLKDDHILSYDTLETEAELFTDESRYDMLSLRRSTGAGDVMFISDVWTYKTDDDGNLLDEDGKIVDSTEDAAVETTSALYSIAMGAAASSLEEGYGSVYDTRFFMQACGEYLVSFFGEDLENNNTPDEAAVRASFLERNSGDKRYKNDEARENGIADERQRLIDLKDDYLFVRDLFDRGVYSHTVYEGTNDDGETYEMALGINVGGLGGISDLVYYNDSESRAVTDKLNLIFFFNGEQNGMLYESVTFLRYLYEEYGE